MMNHDDLPNKGQDTDERSDIVSSERRSVVPEDMAGLRLDQALSRLFPEFSRARLQQWIHQGQVKVNGQARRPRDKVHGGEILDLIVTFTIEAAFTPEDIPLDIIYEDEDIFIVNKPAGLVVHPGAGNRQGTMLNALLHYDPGLATVPRAGIVHRLDKDTTGLLVVARSNETHKILVEQLQQRRFQRIYQAIVWGVMPAGGHVDAPIGRHAQQRTRMAVSPSGREAITHFRVLHRFRGHSHLTVRLETGRTHQIRVHMTHIHHPIVGDPVYGGRLRIPKGATDTLRNALATFRRQALHAAELGLNHPTTNEPLFWQVPLPEDMQVLVNCMQADIAPVPGRDRS